MRVMLLLGAMSLVAAVPLDPDWQAEAKAEAALKVLGGTLVHLPHGLLWSRPVRSVNLNHTQVTDQDLAHLEWSRRVLPGVRAVISARRGAGQCAAGAEDG